MSSLAWVWGVPVQGAQSPLRLLQPPVPADTAPPPTLNIRGGRRLPPQAPAPRVRLPHPPSGSRGRAGPQRPASARDLLLPAALAARAQPDPFSRHARPRARRPAVTAASTSSLRPCSAATSGSSEVAAGGRRACSSARRSSPPYGPCSCFLSSTTPRWGSQPLPPTPRLSAAEASGVRAVG